MYLGIDLGSTNTKAAIYDASLRLVGQMSCPVDYQRENGFVEFDAKCYFEKLASLIAQLTQKYGVQMIHQIALTGQAESLVCIDASGHALMPAISWMDERSSEECRELAAQFDASRCEQVTGQQALLPTWPATKILWLRKHRPDVFSSTATFMLLKDYIVFRLTGRKLADMSIATFTFYFDIYECAYRLYAVERKIDTKVRNIGQQKCYNDLRKRRRSLAWHEQRASRLKNFALVSARKRAAGRNYSGFGFQTASSVRNAAVRNTTRFAGGMRSSAAPAGIKRPSRLGRSCIARTCR